MSRSLRLAATAPSAPISLEVGPRRVRLVGDLDAFTARRVEAELLALAVERRAVVIDLTGVGILTSGGLAVLEDCRDRSIAEGNWFLMVTPGATLTQRVLAFAGVQHHVLQPQDDAWAPRQRTGHRRD